MYSELKKGMKSPFKVIIILGIIISVMLIAFSFIPFISSNLFPKSITYSGFKKNLENYTVVSVKPDFIVGKFMESYVHNKSEFSDKKVTSNAYIGYDSNADKYFGFLVPVEYSGDFEKELNNYFNSPEYTPNIPTIYGTIRNMNKEEKELFEKTLYAEGYVKSDLESLLKSLQEDNLSKKERIDTINKINRLTKTDAALYPITDFYIINYKSLPTRIFNGSLFLIIALLDILVVIILKLLSSKYNKMDKLKYKIETNPNFTELDVEQDFNRALNIDRVYIGNKFIILLAEKNADLLLLENLAWAFVFRLTFFNSTTYYLFTIDCDGNKNITNIKVNNKDNILNLLQEKCPNAYIGYNDAMLDTIDNINSIKNFNKAKLDTSYIPTFNNAKIFLK